MASLPDQERPTVRVPVSWIALLVLVGAGVLGAVAWLGPTWMQVSAGLSGPIQERAMTDEPVITIPEDMRPARRSVAPGQGSLTHGAPANPAVELTQITDARLTATRALLQRWGVFRFPMANKSGEWDSARFIRQSGLQSASLPVDWEMLARLDYPCLLDWKEREGDVRRPVALMSLSATEAVILDPLVGQRVVSRTDLPWHVDGEALILWKAVPGITVPLRPREGNDPVVTALQRALHQQQLLRGAVTGRYDAPTRAAVVRLQHEHGLTATGVFGVRSSMVLSKLALGAKAPSLKAEPGAPRESSR